VLFPRVPFIVLPFKATPLIQGPMVIVSVVAFFGMNKRLRRQTSDCDS
jgi:hypothetical protein